MITQLILASNAFSQPSCNPLLTYFDCADILCFRGGVDLNTINERIEKAINEIGMTKTEVGNKVNVTQQYISKIVKRGNPSDMFIDSFCSKLGINEVWLRTGEGGEENMFAKISSEDRYSLNLGKLTMPENAFIQNAINALAETEPEKLKIVEDFMKKCLGIE